MLCFAPAALNFGDVFLWVIANCSGDVGNEWWGALMQPQNALGPPGPVSSRGVGYAVQRADAAITAGVSSLRKMSSFRDE